MSESVANDENLDNDEVEKATGDREIHDAKILDELIKDHTIDQEGKGVWLIFWKNDDGTWGMGWNKYIGTKPTDEVLAAKGPGEYALVGMAESAKEEVEKLESFSFTTLPAGAELFTIKTVLEKGMVEEDPVEDPVEDPEEEVVEESEDQVDDESTDDSTEDAAEEVPAVKDPKPEEDCGCGEDEEEPVKDGKPTPTKATVHDHKEIKAATFTDSVKVALNTDSAIVDGDTVTFKDIIVAKPMVQIYQIGDEKVRILKCPTELDKAQKFMDHRYVCDDHPLERRVVQPDQILGYLHDSKVTDEKELSTDITITDAALKTKIDNGKKDVSIGFDCALDWKAGTFTDAEGADHAYDAVQRNILIDHLAIVDEGRCSLSDGCGIPHVDVDTADAMAAIKSGIVNTLNDQVDNLTSQLAAPIIDNILSITDKKSREDLSQMTLADLKDVESMLLDAKPADTPSGDGSPVNDTKTQIDKKFVEMGKKKKE